MRKSISSMYFTATALVLVASILVMGCVQAYLFRNYFTEDRREALLDVVQVTTSQVVHGGQLAQLLRDNPELLEQAQKSVSLISRTTSSMVLIADPSGKVQLCSEGEDCRHIGRTLSARVLGEASSAKYFGVDSLDGVFDGQFYTAVSPITGQDNSLQGYVVAASSAQSMSTFLGDMISSFILSAGLMLLVASVLSVALTTRLTRPLRRIAEAARRFGGGDFSERVPVEGADEVAQLAATFNTMARNLEAIDTSRSSFMGNIAHELRTPMTSVKGFIDGMLDGTIPPSMHQHYLNLVSQEVGRLARLVQNMLDRITTKGYNIITSGKNADGNRWSNAIRLKGEGSYVQTALNGEYTLLTGYVAPSSQFSSSLMAKIIVYGDNDQVLYTSKDIHYNEKAFYFGADVTGQNQIRVEVSLTVDNDWDEPVILMDGLSLYK